MFGHDVISNKTFFARKLSTAQKNKTARAPQKPAQQIPQDTFVPPSFTTSGI
jgi:hypothetical protein